MLYKKRETDGEKVRRMLERIARAIRGCDPEDGTIKMRALGRLGQGLVDEREERTFEAGLEPEETDDE